MKLYDDCLLLLGLFCCFQEIVFRAIYLPRMDIIRISIWNTLMASWRILFKATPLNVLNIWAIRSDISLKYLIQDLNIGVNTLSSLEFLYFKICLRQGLVHDYLRKIYKGGVCYFQIYVYYLIMLIFLFWNFVSSIKCKQ